MAGTSQIDPGLWLQRRETNEAEMPKEMILTTEYDTGKGIKITWVKSANRLDFVGWFDGSYGCIMPEKSPTLREFFDTLGITEKDCRKAFKRQP